MEGLSAEDASALAGNVKSLFYRLPSADGAHHSAWSKQLVGLLLPGLSSAGQHWLCPLAASTIAAYVRQFDEGTSMLLQQHYARGVKRPQASVKEDDVRQHLYRHYQAAKSGDRSVRVPTNRVTCGDDVRRAA